MGIWEERGKGAALGCAVPASLPVRTYQYYPYREKATKSVWMCLCTCGPTFDQNQGPERGRVGSIHMLTLADYFPNARPSTPLPAVDKTREAEEAARPPEPPKPPQPQATGHPVLLGGVPDDFAEWEVDKVMEDLAPSVQVAVHSFSAEQHTSHACSATS